jgi:hypothetical protein
VTPELADQLARIADEVRPADLSARVRVASRRARRRRRAAVAATVVVAALAIASGLAGAGWPTPDDTPHVTVVDLAPASAAPSSAPSPTAAKADLFYLARFGPAVRVELLRGTDVSAVLDLSSPVCGLTVSPDHRLIAWTAADPAGTGVGPLMVAHPGADDARKVLDAVRCTGGDMPSWLPGSTRMLVSPAPAGGGRIVDVATGQTSDTHLASLGAYPSWSPNGRYIAFTENGEIVVVRAADGATVHRVAHQPASFSVQGVSDDGRRAVLGPRDTDPDATRSGDRIVDTVTGAEVRLPATIASPDAVRAEVHPAAGDRTLVRIVGDREVTLYLVDEAGKVLDRRAEPSILQSATLLFP